MSCFNFKDFIKIYRDGKADDRLDVYVVGKKWNCPGEGKFDDRFKDDKFYCDNEKITIVSDGVILNKSELFAKYKVTTLEDLLFLLLKKMNLLF